jgi:hypothetical protein
MNGISTSEELSLFIFVFIIVLVAGLFFIVRGLKMPHSFEENGKKRKELKKRLEEAEAPGTEKDGENS